MFQLILKAYQEVAAMSALPLKADMCSAQADVRFVPIADMCSAPARCPLCANRGHKPNGLLPGFDQAIGHVVA